MNFHDNTEGTSSFPFVILLTCMSKVVTAPSAIHWLPRV